MITEYAWAKLNLTLDVLGLRDDGYHDVNMVMQTIDLVDTLRLQTNTGRPWSLTCSDPEIPADETNLAWRAAAAYCQETGYDPEGLDIHIQKNIPSQAGMGGGSADAAAVLRVLNRASEDPLDPEDLLWLAGTLGADVPFCISGGAALAQDRGDYLTTLTPLPACRIVVCTPNFACSTPALYRAIDLEEEISSPDTDAMLWALQTGDLELAARSLKNVFEPIVARDHPEINKIRAILEAAGALGACMTGSGSTMFGIFNNKTSATYAQAALECVYPGRVWLCKPV